MKISLQRVQFMPKELKPNVLYVSEEFGAAAHLCPCGCGTKVRTPLGPTDWALEETDFGPTLYPSIDNWQLPCQSHYWINEGRIVWSTKSTPKQISVILHAAEERWRAYYHSYYRRQSWGFRRFWHWVKSLFE